MSQPAAVERVFEISDGRPEKILGPSRLSYPPGNEPVAHARQQQSQASGPALTPSTDSLGTGLGQRTVFPQRPGHDLGLRAVIR